MPDKIITQNCCDNCGAPIGDKEGLCNKCLEFFKAACDGEGQGDLEGGEQNAAES